MTSLVRLFRRETVSTDFIPVIDGLRFVAIAMVVLFHINVYIVDESAKLAVGPESYYPWPELFGSGHQGVQLFFVISGFVLAMPFMRYGFGLTDRRLSLKSFFLRRLTRLEPPYVVSIIAFFLIRAFVISDRYSLSDLGTSLVSSLFYVSNFVFPGELPHINGVTWSLEIEVQFYILAPFLTTALCLFKNTFRRRLITVLLIVGAAGLSWYLREAAGVQVASLALYLQYFLSGILLCDVVLLDTESLERMTGVFWIAIGALLLSVITIYDHSRSPLLVVNLLSPLMILAFYLIVFGNPWWKKVFSLNALTLIGGMCYTIYLLHRIIISMVGPVTFGRLAVPNHQLFYLMQSLAYLVPIAIISAAYFLLIEKPCMKRDWYKRLYRRLFGTSSGSAALS